jgi:hypothetical protein
LPGHAPFRIPPEFIDRWFPGGTVDGSPPSAVSP